MRIAWLAAAGVVAALGLAAMGCRLCHVPAPTSGALILAAAFPNVTYLGLPVLEATFGPRAAVTLSTALSLFSLPFWYRILA